MNTINLDLPEDILLATGQSREDFIREAKFLLVAKLFELGRLSSGKASQIADMNRVDFILAAGRMGIPVADLDEEEMVREFQDT